MQTHILTHMRVLSISVSHSLSFSLFLSFSHSVSFVSVSLFFVVFLVVTTFILFNVVTSFLFDAYGIQCEVIKDKKRHAQHRAMQRNVPLDGLNKNDETSGLLQVRV